MRKKVSLVLSSGGARGIAHIGIIEELESRGYEICSVAGTSMGALVGAVYAAGNLEAYKKWLFSLSKFDVFRLLDFTLSSTGLVKGEKIFSKLREFITAENIESLNIPFAAVATDIVNKSEVVFKTGSVMDAVRASIAIPSVFTPWQIGTSRLIDGGVLNPLPINHITRFENDILVAVNVNALFPCKYATKTKTDVHKSKAIPNFIKRKWRGKLTGKAVNSKMNFYALMTDSFYLMHNQLAHLMVQYYQPEVDMSISREIATIFDFHNGKQIVEIGRKVAKAALDEYESRG